MDEAKLKLEDLQAADDQDPEAIAEAKEALKVARGDLREARGGLSDAKDEFAAAEIGLSDAEDAVTEAEEAIAEVMEARAGVSAGAIQQMRRNRMGWGQIAHELGVHPGVLGLGHGKAKKKGVVDLDEPVAGDIDPGDIEGLDPDEVEMMEAVKRNTKSGWSDAHGLATKKSKSSKKGLGLTQTSDVAVSDVKGNKGGNKGGNGNSSKSSNAGKSNNGRSSVGGPADKDDNGKGKGNSNKSSNGKSGNKGNNGNNGNNGKGNKNK